MKFMHYPNETQFRYREWDKSTRAARTVTLAVAILALVFLSKTPEPVTRFTQEAALKRVDPVKVDLNAEPVHVEKNWVIMTVPEARWEIAINEPEPVKVPPKVTQPKEPEPVKPKVKPKLKAAVKPPVKVTSSAGSANNAPAISGASQSVTAQTLALEQIIAEVEKRKHYPSRARSIGLEGKALIEADINAQGVVTAVRVTSATHPLFARATMQATRKLPGLSTPVRKALRLQIPVQYRLNE